MSMKADEFGTVTEQTRFGMGWYPSHRRPRCDNCEYGYIRETDTGGSAKCMLGNFATSLAAGCRQHLPVKEVA